MKRLKEPAMIFIAICALESLAANYAHPITPTLIQTLGLPDYMFGVTFAAMAFPNFLFSPFWGKMSDIIGDRWVLLLGCVGYACGQAIFGLAATSTQIIIGRLISGAFTSAISVATLTYLVAISKPEEKARNLTLSATMVAVFSAFGYLVGGVVGDYSIRLTFVLQVVTLVLCGVLYYNTMREVKEKRQLEIRQLMKEANPFSAMFDIRQIMTASLALILAITALTSIAATAYDQNFNYFIKDQFGFKPSYNGLLKAVNGLLSLVSNLTVCMWLIRRQNSRTYFMAILIGCGLLLGGLVMIDQLWPFMILSILYFALYTISTPILQTLISAENRHQIGALMGSYNAVKSFGMIIGSLLAGFLYQSGPKLSFGYAAVLFLAAGGLTAGFIRVNKEKEKEHVIMQ